MQELSRGRAGRRLDQGCKMRDDFCSLPLQMSAPKLGWLGSELSGFGPAIIGAVPNS